jgi:uncharacterized protein YwqG
VPLCSVVKVQQNNNKYKMRRDNLDKTGVQAAFTAAGLSRLVKDIDLLARPSIRLHTTPVAESTLRVGASKLGGSPDLPAGTAWPDWHGLPQSFIAQIRLADVREYDQSRSLPQDGLLWFFYDASQQTFGADPADRGGWRVIFQDGEPAGLRRTPAPAALPAESQFKSCSVGFVSELTLPQEPRLELTSYDWTDEEQKRYEELLPTFPDPADHAAIHHRLLGNPDTIQDDMRQQCQLVSQGVTDDSDPRAARLSKGLLDWQLLLQVDSDENSGMRWGDQGMLYYWMKRADLQGRRFDSTWLILQSD